MPLPLAPGAKRETIHAANDEIRAIPRTTERSPGKPHEGARTMKSVRQPSALCRNTRNKAPTPPVKAPTTTEREATAKRLRGPRVSLFGRLGSSGIGVG